MNDTMRCPTCHTVPLVKMEENRDGLKIIMECQQHGHMAMGASMDSARANWNQYISFVAADAHKVA